MSILDIVKDFWKGDNINNTLEGEFDVNVLNELNSLSEKRVAMYEKMVEIPQKHITNKVQRRKTTPEYKNQGNIQKIVTKENIEDRANERY